MTSTSTHKQQAKQGQAGAGTRRGRRQETSLPPEPARKAKKERKKRRWFAPPKAPPAREEVLTPFNARGTRVRRRFKWAARGYYAPLTRGAPTSTRQAEVLNTAVVAAPTTVHGLAVGRDCLSDSVVTHDPFAAYADGIVSSPNVVVVGNVGAGKSSLCKTVYTLRPLLLRDRRVVIFDKKDRGGQGEYAELVARYGAAPLTFTTTGDGAVLNLLDPVITGAGAKNQVRLLQVVAEIAQDGRALTQWQEGALRSAYRLTMAAAETGGRVPVLPDVLTHLARVDQDSQRADFGAGAGMDKLQQAGLEVRLLLEGLLEEYSGIFDGPTSPWVHLDDKLSSFDISQLPDDGPAVPSVMAIANMWLLGSLRRNRGKKTNLIVEEGWHLVGGPNAALLKNNTKLARGMGLAMVIAIHKIADIPTSSPAMAVLQEAQTIHVFRQHRAEDVTRCVRDFNLTSESGEVIPSLGDGVHLFKRGIAPEVMVAHARSQFEVAMTNTDEAMGQRR